MHFGGLDLSSTTDITAWCVGRKLTDGYKCDCRFYIPEDRARIIEDRDRVRTGLADAGIATATYYRVPLHRQPHFARSCRFGAMPVAERAARHCLSLPMFPQLTDEEVEYVATTAARALS